MFLGAAVFRPGEFNVPGTMVGVLFLGVIQTGLIMLDFETYVVNLVQGGILIGAVLISRLGRAIGRVMTELDSIRKVEVRGLVKTYPGVVALDGADVTIPGGSILGLLGKNGAGKSTLIRCLAGVVQPDAGEVLVDGEPISIASPHDATALGFAFVHQELADVPNLSVAENVLLGLGYEKRRSGLVRRGATRARAREVLDRLEAPISPSAPLSSLSVAERRLVMIARGLAANARMFVLDEPTASLTEDEIDHLHKVLASLRKEGVAIVYVSHRLDEIFAITDRVTVMRDGQTVLAADTAERRPGAS